MRQFSTLFTQIVALVNRRDFQHCVEVTKAERHSRGFASWDQFVALLFCQLGRAQSLREICDGLFSCEGKLYHLGLKGAPRRATLAYANANRPCEMFEQLFARVFQRVSDDLAHQGLPKRQFKFKHKVYSIDSSVIDLCLSMFDWAKFCRTKGAVKLHLKLDHDGCLPCFAVLTEGNVADITVARNWKFEPGAIIVFDRGYSDYAWFSQLCRDKVFFVTRLKRNANYTIVDESRMLMKWEIVSDDVITLDGVRDAEGKCARLRLVTVEDPATRQWYEFLTNNHKLAATTIAEIYRQRWQIELFFKTIKTHLKIKSFLGTSRNAVWTQIWTALITILLLQYLRLRSRTGWSFSNLIAMVRFNLFTRRDLWTWLQAPFDVLAEPPNGQPMLPFSQTSAPT